MPHIRRMIRSLCRSARTAAVALPMALVAAALPLAAGTASAQDTAPLDAAAEQLPATTAATPAPAAPVDIITPHITDGHHLEIPYWKAPFYKEIDLPRWEPFMIGGVTVDLSPTKHVIFLLLAALLTAVVLITAASQSRKQHAAEGRSKGLAGTVEAMGLWLRSEVVLPNVGHHGEAFVPFALTLFFFILACNLLGLIPYGSTATGNISVTATLAIITAIVVELAGVRANGLGYLNTIFYWNKDLPMPIRIVMFFVMTPVEIVGKIAKPFALMIRLFANMTAGHIVLLALISLIFAFQSWVLAGAPVVMAVAISMLEIFVSFLQAFIFTILACVFIGQMREAHH